MCIRAFDYLDPGLFGPNCASGPAPGECPGAAARLEGDLRAHERKPLTVVTGTPSGIFSTFGADLSAVLNDGDELRIMGVTSAGAFQNVRDVRFLKGIDLGFTITNILGQYRRTGEIGDLSDKIVYISRISNDEIHVVTRSNITSFEQLRGLKVNFSTKGSGNQLSAQDIVRALNVDVEEVNLGPPDAFEKLKNGEIAATIFTVGRPAHLIASLKASDGYHLIPSRTCTGW